MVADRVLRAVLLRDIDDPFGPLFGTLAALAEKVVDIAACLVELLRADDQIDVGQVVEDRRASALGHATEKADHLVLGLVLATSERLHLADGFLLGHVAHRAGVEQDNVRTLFVFDQVIAAPGEVARDLFRVADVHLAAIGFDKDGRHEPAKLPLEWLNFERRSPKFVLLRRNRDKVKASYEVRVSS